MDMDPREFMAEVERRMRGWQERGLFFGPDMLFPDLSEITIWHSPWLYGNVEASWMVRESNRRAIRPPVEPPFPVTKTNSYEIKDVPGKGLSMVATQDLSPCDIIAVEPAVLVVPVNLMHIERGARQRVWATIRPSGRPSPFAPPESCQLQDCRRGRPLRGYLEDKRVPDFHAKSPQE